MNDLAHDILLDGVLLCATSEACRSNPALAIGDEADMLSAASAAHRKNPKADSEYSQREGQRAIAQAQSLVLPLRETGYAARVSCAPSCHT
jgi:hypothetical protein